MVLRNRIVAEIGKEILGPRNGPYERFEAKNGKLPPYPPDEYVIGVLEPKSFSRGALVHFGSSIVSGDQEVIRMDQNEGEPDEDEDTTDGNDDLQISPELDPRALPKSIGLSFVVTSKNVPSISICVTWARYKEEKTGWKREPNFFIKHNVTLNEDTSYKTEKDNGVTIVIRRIQLEDGTHVSIYLVNDTPLSKPEKLKILAEELIFQPQIRIVCDEGTELSTVRNDEETDGDEGFGLLYRDRKVRARGHMCGAIWREIDPERAAPVKLNDEEKFSPFYWVDGEIIPIEDCQSFKNPDVRTEFLPCYGIERAAFKGPVKAQLPKLKAELLADQYDPSQLFQSLKPLIVAYGTWIEDQRIKAEKMAKYKEIAEKNLEKCSKTLQRMKEGLELLQKNNDARAAFCFMNKAMHLQSLWKNRARPLEWYPFQIGFILQCISGIENEDHSDRAVCDLLWFPTGAGKTEAYLGLAAFTIALNRRLMEKGGNSRSRAGTNIISRYTLRLLTIQQFRRALRMITACEYLRSIQWAPSNFPKKENPWGETRIAIGLWVGAGVTPNHVVDFVGFDQIRKREVYYLGAIGELFGRNRLREMRIGAVRGQESEPAQVLECPACDGILAISSTTLTPGTHEINWIITCEKTPKLPLLTTLPEYCGLSVQNMTLNQLPDDKSYILNVKFGVAKNSEIKPEDIDQWWERIIKPSLGVECFEEFARASRPGYFFRRTRNTRAPVDFEIHCPNHHCDLNKIEWSAGISTEEGKLDAPILEPFQIPQKNNKGFGMPIPAYTVDDQIYANCPSMIVATVDKFARLAFEPRASSIFGNVNKFDDLWGYFRKEVPPEIGKMRMGKSYSISGFKPPSLILQDELHLIQGPLGSMVGLYETGIEALIAEYENERVIRPKYVASTATIRKARSQVKALFDRELAQFPPQGLSVDDNFFAISHEPHPTVGENPGRLYLGVCAPGRGAQTPIIRIWSSILHLMGEIRRTRGASDFEADQFWTIVGYFNAKRELAGALGLFKADIPERLKVLSSRNTWPLRKELQHIELSGRTESFEIPGKLDRLKKFPDNNIDGVFATSMFGTGVDVDRLGLMIVHGQPKTTANYIQATGRVGRQMGGLVVTFLRASRPRDLDHYEFFVGYHRRLHQSVEPITVFPFSPRARERGLGPLSVLMLRNARKIREFTVPFEWAPEDRKTRGIVPKSGSRIMASRRHSDEIRSIVETIKDRVGIQPEGRKPNEDFVKRELSSWLDRWEAFAKKLPKELVYYESTMTREPSLPVVLGDPSHEEKRLRQVFKNSPQSLRDVEATTTFDDEV